MTTKKQKQNSITNVSSGPALGNQCTQSSGLKKYSYLDLHRRLTSRNAPKTTLEEVDIIRHRGNIYHNIGSGEWHGEKKERLRWKLITVAYLRDGSRPLCLPQLRFMSQSRRGKKQTQGPPTCPSKPGKTSRYPKGARRGKPHGLRRTGSLMREEGFGVEKR